MLPPRNREAVLPGRLRPLIPFDQLTAEQLIVAAGRAQLRRFRAGDVVLARGSEDAADYFLLDGNIALIDAAGNSRSITSGSAAAEHALSPARPCLDEVRAMGPVSCAVFAREEVAALRQAAPRERGAEFDSDLEHARGLLDDLLRDLRADRVRLPSLPDIALRVRRAVADERCDNRRLAELLTVDPAMAAKILKIANSPLCRGTTAVTNLLEAVTRIGAYTVGELVVCFSLKDVFKAVTPALRERFAAMVGESVRIAATASVIGQRVGGLGDRALIAGLLCNIGAFPLLERAAQHPEFAHDEPRMAHAATVHAARVGRLLCEQWGLGDDVAQAVAEAKNWDYVGALGPELAEVVICARYHTWLGLGRVAQLPKPAAIPAMRVLGDTLTPALSVEIIRAAKSRVEALLKALG